MNSGYFMHLRNNSVNFNSFELSVCSFEKIIWSNLTLVTAWECPLSIEIMKYDIRQNRCGHRKYIIRLHKKSHLFEMRNEKINWIIFISTFFIISHESREIMKMTIHFLMRMQLQFQELTIQAENLPFSFLNLIHITNACSITVPTRFTRNITTFEWF